MNPGFVWSENLSRPDSWGSVIKAVRLDVFVQNTLHRSVGAHVDIPCEGFQEAVTLWMSNVLNWNFDNLLMILWRNMGQKWSQTRPYIYTDITSPMWYKLNLDHYFNILRVITVFESFTVSNTIKSGREQATKKHISSSPVKNKWV